LLRQQQAAGEPGGLVLDALIEDAAATVVECWRRGVLKEAMAELVAQVAVLAGSAVSVVVHDGPASPGKHRDCREDIRFYGQQMPDLWSLGSEHAEPEDWDRKVIGEGVGVEGIE
jgi:hypothetical protein